MRSTLTVILLVLAVPRFATADDRGVEATWHASVETSPQFFLMDGWAVAVGLRTPMSPRLRFVANAFAVGIPQAFLGDNRDKGWTRHDLGAAVGAQYFVFQPDDQRGGASLGLLAAVQRQSYTNGGDRDHVDELVAMAQIGYQWFPLAKHGLYVMPWIGIGLPVVKSEEAMANGMTFQPKPVNFVPAAFIGWEL